MSRITFDFFYTPRIKVLQYYTQSLTNMLCRQRFPLVVSPVFIYSICQSQKPQ